MKTTITITANEANELIEALRNHALNFGWNEEELDDCGVMEEYTEVVDVALATLGLDLKIDISEEEPEEEEEDEEPEDEEVEEAFGPFIKARYNFIETYLNHGGSLEDAEEIATALFGSAPSK